MYALASLLVEDGLVPVRRVMVRHEASLMEPRAGSEHAVTVTAHHSHKLVERDRSVVALTAS